MLGGRNVLSDCLVVLCSVMLIVFCGRFVVLWWEVIWWLSMVLMVCLVFVIGSLMIMGLVFSRVFLVMLISCMLKCFLSL